MQVTATYTPLDGYAWMAQESDAGFQMLPELGDWPYVCYAKKRLANGTIKLYQFIEHDEKLYEFENQSDYVDFVQKIESFDN